MKNTKILECWEHFVQQANQQESPEKQNKVTVFAAIISNCQTTLSLHHQMEHVG